MSTGSAIERRIRAKAIYPSGEVMKMDGFFAMLIAMTLLACNMLKKVTAQKETSEQHQSVLHQTKISSNRQLQREQHFLEWRLDSTNRNDVVKIWPKGKFSFSPEHGFEGEATEIMLTSKMQRTGASLKVEDSLSKDKSVLDAEQSHKTEERTGVKSTTKEESPAFWPALIVVLIAAACLALLIYKLTNI